MAIPDYQSMMLPLLDLASKHNEISNSDAAAALAQHFNVSDDELKVLQPSGHQAVFYNRFGWARTYLKKASLLEYPKRGYFSITDLGRKIHEQRPDRIDIKFLRQFPSFVDFIKGSKKDQEEKVVTDAEHRTPEEIILSGYATIRKELADEILSRVKKCSPEFFERLVVELLVKMGYGGSLVDAGEAIGKSGDGGVDGVIKEDKLGLDVIFIQAKRWENTVTRPELQKFAGALQGKQAKKGVFITTSSFSKEAGEFASRIENKMILIDGDLLTQLMIDYGVGVSTSALYEIKKIDSDYFEEELF